MVFPPLTITARAAALLGPSTALSPTSTGREDTARPDRVRPRNRSEAHTSELQSLMRISYAVFCLQTKQNLGILPDIAVLVSKAILLTNYVIYALHIPEQYVKMI